MEQISLKIGDMVHTPGGRDGRIAEFSHDNQKVKVNFTFGQQHRWCDVADVKLVQAPQARQAAAQPNSSDAYPAGKVLTNVAGEAVKVISQWKDLVKLQPLMPINDGAKQTDFEPVGEPFTLSEQDVHQWLLKWLKPGDVVELVDGRIVILVEINPLSAVSKSLSDEQRRDNIIGKRFDFDNPLTGDIDMVYIEAIKSKVTAPVAQAFRILAEPGNPNLLQRTIDDLRVECTLLHRQVDTLKANSTPTLPTGGEGVLADKVARAEEDAAKYKAAFEDAEKRVRILEDKNRQQSRMLSEATALPQNQHVMTSTQTQHQHIMTLVSIGGNAGFGNVEIPTGYQVAAITTEFRPAPGTPQIYRFTHLIGCGDGGNQTRYEEKTERIPAIDDEPENSFEAALKGGYAPEDVIAVGNERVVEMAWEAAQSRRAAHQPVPMMLTGGQL